MNIRNSINHQPPVIDTEGQTSLLRSKAAIITLIGWFVLLVAVSFQWRYLGWEKAVWLVSFLLMFVIRTPHSMANRKNKITSDSNDIGEKIVLVLAFMTMMFLPLIYLASDVLSFADYQIPQWASVLGGILLLPFLWLFWRSHSDLGRNWSPGLEVRDGHQLITQGVYRKIRHPMYAAIWISVFAQALLLHNWIAGVLAIPAFAALYVLRIPKEEVMMTRQFGSEYKDYKLQTGRIIPAGFPLLGRAVAWFEEP